MDLESKIMPELKAAMKAKNQAALRSIRAIKAAILLHKTSGQNELGKPGEIKLLQKLIKQRQDSLSIYKNQNRADLAKLEEEEIDIISNFLPVQLSAQEIEVKIKAIINKIGASTMKDMGKVMGMASKEMGGTADGKSISLVVKKLLSS